MTKTSAPEPHHATDSATVIMEELSAQMALREAADLMDLIDVMHTRHLPESQSSAGRSERAAERGFSFMMRVLQHGDLGTIATPLNTLHALRPYVSNEDADCLLSAAVSALTDMRHFADVDDLDWTEMVARAPRAVHIPGVCVTPVDDDSFRDMSEDELFETMKVCARQQILLTLQALLSLAAAIGLDFPECSELSLHYFEIERRVDCSTRVDFLS